MVDCAFGQLMLTLRTHIGLKYAGLAELLGISRRAMAEWEAGSSANGRIRLTLSCAVFTQHISL